MTTPKDDDIPHMTSEMVRLLDSIESELIQLNGTISRLTPPESGDVVDAHAPEGTQPITMVGVLGRAFQRVTQALTAQATHMYTIEAKVSDLYALNVVMTAAHTGMEIPPKLRDRVLAILTDLADTAESS